MRYLVEKSVGGHADEIKEFTIALEVFGRASYDPQSDSQVRVEVGKLRERLERYYAAEGLNEPLRIVIPKGSYQPIFEATAVPEPAGVENGSTAGRPKRSVVLGSIAAVLLAGTVTGLVWDQLRQTPTVDKPSLVVLPFEDLSPDKDQEYFCSGIAEELTSTLSRMQIFHVLPRSYGAEYARRPADARTVGAKLKVHAVVEGAVRKENSHIRITVRLIDARGGGQLWSATYDRELGQVLETQQEIADSVARSFNVDLPDTRHALVRQRTRNAEAYDHYLRAAYLYTNEVDRSVEYYKAAVAADPSYALAWAGLAAAWVRLTDWYMVSPGKARENALRAAAKAMDLDSNLAEAQHVWGAAKLYYERDWRTAETALRRAIELDPMRGEHRWEYTRLILIPTGRFAEAAEQMHAAIALEPLAAAHYNALANRFIKARQYDEALPYLETSRKISPTGVSAIVLQGMLALGKDNYGEAFQRFEEAARIRRSIWVLGYLGFALGKLGQTNAARDVIAELEKQAKDGPKTDFEVAAVHVGLGDKERAMEYLERALAASSHSLLWAKVDGRQDDLRGHPRFPVLIKALGL